MARKSAKDRVAINVERLRTQQGLTKDQLAERSKLGRMTIYRIEGGTSDPKLSHVERLAAVLGVDLTEVLQ